MLQKQPVSINFNLGVDTKTDPYQVQIGKFLTLVNSVFTTGGRLTKRFGFDALTPLPNSVQTTLTTLNDNLIATGSNLYSLSADTSQWLNKGTVQPVSLSVLPVVRTSTSQTGSDSVVAPSGLACVVYADSSSGYYHVVDSNTGEQIVSRVQLAATATNPRVFLLGAYFVITYTATVSSASHLQYILVPVLNPSNPSAPIDISTTLPNLTVGYNGVNANNSLYISWADTGSTVKVTFITSSDPSVPHSPTVVSGHTATLLSVTSDISQSTPVIWVTFWDSSSTNGYTMAFNALLGTVLAPTQIITITTINEITAVARNMVLTVLYENANNYASPYPNTVKSDFISKLTVTQSGTVSSATVVLRSVGLASKAFMDSVGTIYMMVVYGGANQPTYFLANSSGNVYMRLAYQNGGGYEASQVLPYVSFVNGSYYVSYLFKDFLAGVNKGTNLPSGTPTNGIYTQTGVNLAKFAINTSGQLSSAIASTLHLTGGQLWQYDAVAPVEHSFHVWPEDAAFTTATTGGHLSAQKYFYQFTYEWTDNQGNLHRSAPSIPLEVDLTSAGTSTSTNTLYVPTLRLTYKTSVRVVGYRWSTAQEVFYQFTSITSPTLSSTTSDYVTITDTLADSSILGNPILYTTGGVIENIASPASIASTLYKSRLFLIDAEDQNLLWFSKQVIEATPVEMSDLLTLFVAPTTGAQGSTGPMTALAAMDDKLIIFKNNAIYYITGNGPDNTGANNDFSDPIFITASVGCSNPQSIVLTPDGVMFQSDKGIWLLGRDLSTSYIGKDVEEFNSQTVESAQVIPGTTQVRFILNNSLTLMYDYFYRQWGWHTNLNAISSALYQGKHTYLNEFGLVFQESSSSYLDGSIPVLMSFTTSWINLAGLQGFERFYFLYLLGTYFTPFKLNVQVAFGYNPSPLQSVIVTPSNFTPSWGGDAQWGSNQNWGGGQGDGASSDHSANVFSARVFPNQQKCDAFQLQVSEMCDPSLGVAAGEGLSLSGMNLVIGVKRGHRTQRASTSFG